MDLNTYVEEENWNIVTTLAHMLSSVGKKSTCGTQLEKKYLVLEYLDSEPS